MLMSKNWICNVAHVYRKEEVSKLAKVKAQVSEVKGVMMENIEKVLDRGEKSELLVDKTENLRLQGFLVFLYSLESLELCSTDAAESGTRTCRPDPLLLLTNGPVNPQWDRWFEGAQDAQGCICLIL
ncbi:hypothetical protein JRO89_XS05G0122700 [Xanthoceras sorbifolium]|uniref:V-SNARE coiled-coil homology domain-containing protein n=1 Tax=Xanthoceras sorbifolium TaxID=99658 RepID=A0ABQ8I1L1_9ROSI|nr:hypothetical protein JRO89_XS05G0122700 [Xanthoceras sorbifolium]